MTGSHVTGSHVTGSDATAIERLPPDLAAAYLHRLGLDPDEVAIHPRDGVLLADLHRAQVERVAYENVDVYRGSPRGLDPVESARQLVEGRGGYCYQQNGAFSALLNSLGFVVRRHVGGVRGRPDDALADAMTNHLALTVELADGLWLADCGLGDLLHVPVPLRAGPLHQGGFGYRLEQLDGEMLEGDVWRLTHDPRSGSFHDMTFAVAPVGMAAFAARHEWLGTDPASPFVRILTVQRRSGDAVEGLRGLVRYRVTAAGRTEVELTEADAWFAALEDDFGVSMAHLSGTDREVLWRRLGSDHDAWAAAPGGRPAPRPGAARRAAERDTPPA